MVEGSTTFIMRDRTDWLRSLPLHATMAYNLVRAGEVYDATWLME